MYKCKYEGIGVFADRCIATRTAEACVGYEKCERYKPNYTTNADRIRAMSDEELLNLFRYRGCPPDRLTGKCGKVGVCAECWADWLKQPCERE